MNLLSYQHFFLVGIKGVAMTSLANLLRDAGKQVSGSDVAEDFITYRQLASLQVAIIGLDDSLPADAECVVFTAAHQGSQQRQVAAARERGILTVSHAEALAYFFNQKSGLAVCGVGGKSTISAMAAWILEKTGRMPSYSVGVGGIAGLPKTGVWRPESTWFVAEADEYAANPTEAAAGERVIPRFSFLRPQVAVCSHIRYDHPDVYKSFDDTLSAFRDFFTSIQPGGHLILHEDDQRWLADPGQYQTSTVGTSDQTTLKYSLDAVASQPGATAGSFTLQGTTIPVLLQVPGEYNLENAAFAALACSSAGVPLEESIAALASFASTSRRFEARGMLREAACYDDYAHHPSELSAVLAALGDWYPGQKTLVAFQPHTFSRTKKLFDDFTDTLAGCPHLVLLDIFASARETDDPSISSQALAEAIKRKNPDSDVTVLPDYTALAAYLDTHAAEFAAILTTGAGDIYKAFDMLEMQPMRQQQVNVGSQKDAFGQLQKLCPDTAFSADEPLAPYTTVKIGGPADFFCRVQNSVELAAVITAARSLDIPATVLGWGANTLIADEGIRGLVIKNMSTQIAVHQETPPPGSGIQSPTPRWRTTGAPAQSAEFAQMETAEAAAERVLVTLDSGVSLPVAMNQLFSQGITGLQWFSRIPASIGGAIYNNIHGGTHFISDLVRRVQVLTETGETIWLNAEALAFDYDYSRFHGTSEIILAVELVLYRSNTALAKTVMTQWAVQKAAQPQKTLGSVFQNLSAEDQQRLGVPTPSIGYLIEHKLGLKGFRIGDAQVSLQHAGFIENTGVATAADYLAVIQTIIAAAADQLQVTLKPEIFFLGFTSEALAGITSAPASR
jgi:UDP-N-acetylenolpyruvoylglucosamine reductase